MLRRDVLQAGQRAAQIRVEVRPRRRRVVDSLATPAWPWSRSDVGRGRAVAPVSVGLLTDGWYGTAAPAEARLQSGALTSSSGASAGEGSDVVHTLIHRVCTAGGAAAGAVTRPASAGSRTSCCPQIRRTRPEVVRSGVSAAVSGGSDRRHWTGAPDLADRPRTGTATEPRRFDRASAVPPYRASVGVGRRLGVAARVASLARGRPVAAVSRARRPRSSASPESLESP